MPHTNHATQTWFFQKRDTAACGKISEIVDFRKAPHLFGYSVDLLAFIAPPVGTSVIRSIGDLLSRGWC